LKGVLVSGTTGESYNLSLNERKNILEKWMNTEAVKTGKLEVLVMAHCNSLVETIDLAK